MAGVKTPRGAASEDAKALAGAVCSIARTQRRRFFWAAWWTEPPAERPFRKPDASNGGAPTWEDALREAEHAAGRALSPIDSRWARAWMRALRGEPPIVDPPAGARSPEPARLTRASVWAILNLEPGASTDEIKRAYRRRALETHPDRGGDAEIFRAVQSAYERAMNKRQKEQKRPKARSK